jgi:hypothetical protein
MAEQLKVILEVQFDVVNQEQIVVLNWRMEEDDFKIGDSKVEEVCWREQ